MGTTIIHIVEGHNTGIEIFQGDPLLVNDPAGVPGRPFAVDDIGNGCGGRSARAYDSTLREIAADTVNSLPSLGGLLDRMRVEGMGD